MSWLCDTTELVPSGWLSSRYAGHGVLAEDIPSTGLDGPSALYGAVTLPADNGKEIRGYVTRWPAAPLDIEEDGTFTYSGGPDYFEFLLAVDGVDSTANIGFGAGISRIWLGMEPGGSFSGSVTLSDVAASGSFIGSLPTNVGRPFSDLSNTGWTPSTGVELHPMIGEAIPNSGTYILSTVIGQQYEAALSTTIHPGSSTQVLKFRGSSGTGNSVIVRLKNLDGAIVLEHTQALTPIDTEYSINLSPSEIAAITSGALSVVIESA
jgi:hypothetical protein